MKQFLRILFIAAALACNVPLFATGDPAIIGLTIIADVAIIGGLVLPYQQSATLSMNGIEARMAYENSVRALCKAFKLQTADELLSVVKLTQGSLRFEQLLVAGQTLYTFPILDNQTVFSNLEDRLTLQDSFVINSVFVGTGAPSSATDNTFVPDTYPNTQKYGANAVPLQAWWNAGNLQIAVNNDIITPKWDLWRHFNNPETQQTAALGAGSPGDQARGAFDGWYPMEPNVVMIGQKNTTLQVILKGAGLASVQAFSRGIIMVRGYLAQNSTVVS